jgi:hypothetical protein
VGPDDASDPVGRRDDLLHHITKDIADFGDLLFLSDLVADADREPQQPPRRASTTN